jgi:IS1 family transposase
MSFTTRILLDTFKQIGEATFRDGFINFEIGDVVQNGETHLKMALRVTVQYQLTDNTSTYVQIFKGTNKHKKAADWLFQMTEGEFGTEAASMMESFIAERS